MRLRHIEVFHAVMQAGTISGAAQLLHVSQPAVTKVIQHCEQQLGIPLFNRVRGKFYPTPEAERLFIEVDKLNRDLHAIRRLAANLRGGEAELVRLTATPTLGLSVIPSALTRWSKAYPKGRCVLSTNHTREIVSALLAREADLGLSLQDPRHPAIHAEPLASGPMTALCPRTGRQGKSDEPLSVSALGDDLIGMTDDDPLGNALIAQCEAHGVTPQIRITVQTYQLARSLAEAGVGMTVVDPFTAAGADRSKLRLRPLEPLMPVQLFLLTANVAPLSQPARRLVGYLGEAAHGCLASNETLRAA